MDTQTSRRLLAALAISLAVHAAVVGGLPLALPDLDPQPLPMIEAQLVTSPPPRPAPPPAPRQPKHHRRVPAAAAPVAIPDAIAIAAPQPAPDVEQQPGLDAAEPAFADEAPAEVAPTSVAPVAAAPETPLPARVLPRHFAIDYAMFIGSDKFNVGRAVATWNADDDSYRLTTVAETTGLAALFKSIYLSYRSEGRLTDAGLRPETFTVTRTRSGRTDGANARFDWSAMTLTYGAENEQRQGALSAQTQDIISFAYQLAMTKLEPGPLELSITNGFKIDTYEVEVGAEEPLETPMGQLRTIPIRQNRQPGKEGIELWLAVDYRMLPVRVRFLDRQGRMSGEQLASAIDIPND